ncbi:NgoFVII family restriction endonuclease [Priestia aryabhattai]|uniref:restriction endonuclease PLD domain-containing protein n=1 Tax=Priestia aryabhattai TaxID=412384 RepID=UPI001C8EA7F8|nr:restriction endonuclease PLD domain-containing protein [Priestia aryabhattai]MBY0001441.1 NgoFVII family restriction endonuclease [Priestia aryabhattai]
MYYIKDLEKEVFELPYKRKNFRKIKILTGYASSAFLFHILEQYPDIEIDLIIGMAKKDGINSWDHERYLQLVNEYPKVNIYYRTLSPGIHSKIYYWYDDEYTDNSITFVGSANFSWNGFRDQIELLVEANHENIDQVFNVAKLHLISCTNPNVEEHINFVNLRLKRTFKANEEVQIVEEARNPKNNCVQLLDLPYVDLSLMIDRTNSIHGKSGLNWGQRDGREPNQAYIPVPVPFNNANPNFFPPLKQNFTLITDDEQQLICVMAQSGRKAIHTSKNNSIMGRYFRQRLGVPLGSKVKVQDLLNYGRTQLRIYKIDSETYFMDFGVNL